MNNRLMTDCHVVAHANIMLVQLTVKDASVLDVRVSADGDLRDVSADHRVEPNSGILAHLDVAGDNGARSQERSRMNLGMMALMGENQRSQRPADVAMTILTSRSVSAFQIGPRT